MWHHNCTQFAIPYTTWPVVCGHSVPAWQCHCCIWAPCSKLGVSRLCGRPRLACTKPWPRLNTCEIYWKASSTQSFLSSINAWPYWCSSIWMNTILLNHSLKSSGRPSQMSKDYYNSNREPNECDNKASTNILLFSVSLIRFYSDLFIQKDISH